MNLGTVKESEESQRRHAQLKEILVEQLYIEESTVIPSALLVDDLGADDLDIIELMMELEEEFDIEIPDEDCEKWKTVEDIENYLIIKGVKYEEKDISRPASNDG